MRVANYTAIGAFVVYWLKLIVGGIAFLKGEYSVAGAVLLLGSAVEILLYSITLRR